MNNFHYCPKCHAELEFAQCDWRVCEECGWEGGWEGGWLSALNKLPSEPCTLRWSPEFEKMWRTRLEVMQQVEAPFHQFIQKLSEVEIADAFVLALDEIERLRKGQCVSQIGVVK